MALLAPRRGAAGLGALAALVAVFAALLAPPDFRLGGGGGTGEPAASPTKLGLQAAQARTQSPLMLDSDPDAAAAEASSLLQIIARSNSTGSDYWIDLAMMAANPQGYQWGFCGNSKDGCKTLDNFPGMNTHSDLTWDKVVQELQKVPKLQEDGTITRRNELGYLKLNSGFWDRDVKHICLADSVAEHRFYRPMLDRLFGSAGEGKFWSIQQIEKDVAAFLSSKASITSQSDVFMWVTKLLHKIHFDLDFSDEEAAKFVNFQLAALGDVVLPFSVMTSMLQDTRASYLHMYQEAIKADTRGAFPKDLTNEQQHMLAIILLDSLAFAGGLSIGMSVKVGLSVLYADPSPWQVADNQLTATTSELFGYEVLRRYPGVVGFPWYDTAGKRIIMNLAMALRDPKIWGADFLSFKLRPLQQYTKYQGVAWAQPASGPKAWAAAVAAQNPGRSGGLEATSRGCPAQALSMEMMQAFFKAWALKQKEYVVVDNIPGGIHMFETTPWVAEFTLGKLSKTGSLLLSATSGLPWSQVTTLRKEWAVLAGSKLLLFKDNNYKKDNPSAADLTVDLSNATSVEATSGPAKEKCFTIKKISGSVPLLCADGATALEKQANQALWIKAIQSSL